MTRSVTHASFTITRTWKALPARVFDAFAKEEAKRKWFTGPPGSEIREKSFDFRVGGRETLTGKHASGMISAFDCTYHDIVSPTEDGEGRIVYSYVMHVNGKKISVSQTCVEIRPEDGGARLVLTEYGDYLDGYEDGGSREHGTNFLIDALGKSLEDRAWT